MGQRVACRMVTWAMADSRLRHVAATCSRLRHLADIAIAARCMPQRPLGLAAGYKDVADSGYFYSGASIVAPRTMGGQAAAARIPVKWRMNEPWITPVGDIYIYIYITAVITAHREAGCHVAHEHMCRCRRRRRT